MIVLFSFQIVSFRLPQSSWKSWVHNLILDLVDLLPELPPSQLIGGGSHQANQE